MRRRTKRRLALVGGLSAALVAGYVLYWPKDTRPRLAAFGSSWAVEQVNWKPLFEQYALSFDLNLDQGLGELQTSSANLAALCEAVLGKLPTPPSADLARDDVYRISFNVKSQRVDVFDEDISIAVLGGVCQARDLDQPFVHTYPAPMNDWTLRADLDVSLSAGDAPEYSFKWEGAGEADLEAFPFEAACEALVSDPPASLARPSGKPPKSVTIWAEKEIGEAGSGQFTAATQAFEVLDGECVEAQNS